MHHHRKYGNHRWHETIKIMMCSIAKRLVAVSLVCFNSVETSAAYIPELAVRPLHASPNLSFPGRIPISDPQSQLTRCRAADGDGDQQQQQQGLLVRSLSMLGVISQPIVWISLYNVATTGGGLPAGPFGLLGALEGLAYLAVVGWAIAPIIISEHNNNNDENTLPVRLSQLTLLVALATLASLVGREGCVPNAKPILDYSAYLPVCDASP